jgi:hypothetical protein
MLPALVRWIAVGFIALPIIGQAQQASPGALTWSVGVTRGLGGASDTPLAGDVDARTGSLLVEWRRTQRRLGVRLELIRAIDDRYGAYVSCTDCRYATVGTSNTLLLSGIVQFRAERRLRFHLALGAGMHAGQTRSESNADCDVLSGPFCVPIEGAPAVFSFRQFGTALGGAAGTSLHFGRLDAFAELRATILLDASSSAVPAPLAIGVRVRPE